MDTHPLIDRIAAALAAIAAPEPIELRGGWSRSMRRTYRDASQAGSGAGPFADVVDVYWKGAVECAQPIAGIAFLQTRRSLHWVKSRPASLQLGVQVSLHAYADHSPGGATFSASLGESFLPGVPVTCGPELEAACAIGPAHTATGRAHRVAEIDGVAFIAVLIPGALLKTGRNHLWRLRDAFAADLPDDVRALLTRQRTGAVDPI
ncbi:MAG: hypothetical protein E6J87_02110 [Deltaproteobacteria bacterium]|nr:MAG: hypothetical protein E6J87_02110 [Deltaproteobacteria bacterium]